MDNEIFYDVLFEVGDENGKTAWYEIFDSDLMDEVDRRLIERFGVEDVWDIEGYGEWYDEMAGDL